MSTVAHTFFQVHMGIGHKGCEELVQSRAKNGLGKNDVAIFLNKKWNAAKIMYPSNTIIYWRSPTGAAITPEQLRFLPSRVASARLTFAGKLENTLLNRYTKDVGVGAKRIKAVTA